MQNKKVLIGGGVALLVIVAYTFLSGGSAPSSGFSVTDSGSGAAAADDSGAPAASAEAASLAGSIEQELINELLNLKNITLDRSILDSPAYASLQDFSRPIEPESVGRPNPFAPYDAAATSTSNSNTLPF